MASIKLYATLATIAALCSTTVALPLFPPALPTEPTEATEDVIPTEQTPEVKIPADLANFLKTHMDNKGANSNSTSTSNSTQDDMPDSLRNFLGIHIPDSSNHRVMFHVQMGRNITLRKSAEIELQNFTQPIATELKPGHFVLGKPSFNPLNGAFIAPVKGIYHFTAQVHLFDNHLQEAIGNSSVNVSICIDRDCKNNAALQSIAGITSERFSALVTGELQLEKDQVVSVFVKNNSDRRLVVGRTTALMGFFITA